MDYSKAKCIDQVGLPHVQRLYDCEIRQNPEKMLIIGGVGRPNRTLYHFDRLNLGLKRNWMYSINKNEVIGTSWVNVPNIKMLYVRTNSTKSRNNTKNQSVDSINRAEQHFDCLKMGLEKYQAVFHGPKQSSRYRFGWCALRTGHLCT